MAAHTKPSSIADGLTRQPSNCIIYAVVYIADTKIIVDRVTRIYLFMHVLLYDKGVYATRHFLLVSSISLPQYLFAFSPLLGSPAQLSIVAFLIFLYLA